MLQRIAIYATLGCLLDALGHDWNTWGFWCVLGLFIAVDALARREGYEAGMVFVATLPEAALIKIKQEVDKILKGSKDD